MRAFLCVSEPPCEAILALPPDIHMKFRLLDWIACPACGERLDVSVTRAEDRPTWEGVWEPGENVAGREGAKVTEILEGRLRCRGCASVYAITEGVPRLLPDAALEGPSTGHRWTKFDQAVPAYEALLRELVAPWGPDEFLGKLVLDAGCGFGRHAFFATRWGAEVVALDSSAEAVASAAHNLAGLPRAHVVQGDVDRPPFRPQAFDVALAFGLLHHVADARATFRTLDGLVASGGRLLTWTCGPRQGLLRIATGALRGATAEMAPDQLYRFCQGLALALRAGSHTPYKVLGAVPVVGGLATHLPVHDHAQWPFDVVVADLYDRLRVPLTGTFTGEAVENWFAEAGYADIDVRRRVRNTETFVGRGTKR